MARNLPSIPPASTVTDPTSNPAARLFEILTVFKKSGSELGNSHLSAVWHRVFGHESPDSVRLFRKLVDLQELAQSVRTEVTRNPRLKDGPHLKTFHRVEKLLSATNLNQNWKDFDSSVDAEVLTALELTAHFLGYAQPEAAIASVDLDAARAELENAYKSLEAAGLPEDLAKVLKDILDAMQFAMGRYRTAGVDAFWEAWTKMAWLIKIAEKQEANGSPIPKSVGVAVGKVFRRATEFANKAKVAVKGVLAIKEAADAVDKFIEGIKDVPSI